MLKQKNSKKQGDVGMGAAISWFASNGWTVCVPLTDSQEYDLVVGDEVGKLFRVQVKTTTQKSRYDKYVVELRTIGGNKTGTGKVKHFDCSLIDYLFVLTEKGDRYLIPTGIINAISGINLGGKYEEFKLE